MPDIGDYETPDYMEESPPKDNMKQKDLDAKTLAFEERMKERKAAEDAAAKQEEADKAEKLRAEYLNRTGRKRMEP